MKKKTSLKDIAQKLGVSITLVSYVLNNKKTGRINKEVAIKIKETAEELNYSPNRIAQSLKTNKTFTIGLIVSNISNPFSSNLARLIEDEAEKSNYTVLFGSSDENSEKSWKLINIFLNRQVDGFIIAPAENSEQQIHYLIKNEIPFILIDRYYTDIKTSYVALDNFKGSYMAVKHVAESGRKKIGMITFNTSLLHLQERKNGYVSALKELNLPVKKSWLKEVSLHVKKEEIEKAVDQLISTNDPVEAILFSSNTLASFGLKYIIDLNIRVPSDLAIICFDEVQGSEFFYAPLTYIKQPLQEMGQLATRLLLESIGNNNKITQVNMEPELIIRKSTIVV